MSKRNLKLLIIVLITITIATFGFLYFSNTSTVNQVVGIQGTNFISQFFPSSKPATQTPEVTPPANISGFEPAPTTQTPIAKLNKISSMPVAGFGIFMKERFKEVPTVVPIVTTEQITTPTENTTITTKTEKPTAPPTEFIPAIRYVDRATGNIYQTFADKIDERKFSGTVIPEVNEAYLANNGESVVMRYLKSDGITIESFIGSLPKEFLGADTTGNNEISGSFLPENITDMSISPDSLKLFYLFNTTGNTTVGITLDPLTNKKSQIFDSSFTEWTSFWPNKNIITLTSKPSANVPGYMYMVDVNKKDFNKVLGGINGLTTLTSPDGKLVLYSNNNLSLGVYNINTREVSTLGIKTLPEKCVWNKTSDAIYCAVPKFIDTKDYPDSWYMGETSFSDEIWKINIADGRTTIVSDMVSASGAEDIDGTKLALDEGENYLFFVNKKDSYLWELNLK
jgi:hypothetical protein